MRRVLVDTNVLLSALVFPRGVSASAFWRVVTEERLVLTEWVLAEARDVVSRKWLPTSRSSTRPSPVGSTSS